MIRYVYSVSKYETSDPENEELIGEGSGPIPHVAENLRRLADQIDPPKTVAAPDTFAQEVREQQHRNDAYEQLLLSQGKTGKRDAGSVFEEHPMVSRGLGKL